MPCRLSAKAPGGTSMKVMSRRSAEVSAAAISPWVMDAGPVKV